MVKLERIAKIEAAPEGSAFVVKAPNGMYWMQGDRGYTEHIELARVFGKQEIIDRLIDNGFMDKTIEIFTPSENI